MWSLTCDFLMLLRPFVFRPVILGFLLLIPNYNDSNCDFVKKVFYRHCTANSAQKLKAKNWNMRFFSVFLSASSLDNKELMNYFPKMPKISFATLREWNSSPNGKLSEENFWHLRFMGVLFRKIWSNPNWETQTPFRLSGNSFQRFSQFFKALVRSITKNWWIISQKRQKSRCHFAGRE